MLCRVYCGCALGVALLLSCADREPFLDTADGYSLKASHDLAKIMVSDYLWASSVRADRQYGDQSLYSDPFSLLDSLRVQDDRFTFLLPKEAVGALLDMPTDFGFFTRYLHDTLYVAHVYEGSPAHRAGLRRGYRIVRVNDRQYTPRPTTPPSSHFGESPLVVEFRQEANAPLRSITLAKALYQQKSISVYRTLDGPNGKIGYLHLISFGLRRYADDLRRVFSLFKKEQVQELVVDLRYNSGGYESVALALGSLIFDDAQAKVFVKHVFNERLQGRRDDVAYFADEPHALSLSRCFFLVDKGTASASELLIHALRPHMQVLLVGQPTVGKNVGSYRFYLPLDYKTKTYVFHPIIFRITNANGRSYNSSVPNHSTPDDVRRPLGDPQEGMLAAALYYIHRGSFPDPSARKVAVEQPIFSFTEPTPPLLIATTP